MTKALPVICLLVAGCGGLVGGHPRCTTAGGMVLLDSPQQIDCAALQPYEDHMAAVYRAHGYAPGMLRGWYLDALPELDSNGTIGDRPDPIHTGQRQRYAGITYDQYRLVQIGDIGARGPRVTGYMHELAHVVCDMTGQPHHGYIGVDPDTGQWTIDPADPWGDPRDPGSWWQAITTAQGCLSPPWCDDEPKWEKQ